MKNLQLETCLFNVTQNIYLRHPPYPMKQVTTSLIKVNPCSALCVLLVCMCNCLITKCVACQCRKKNMCIKLTTSHGCTCYRYFKSSCDIHHHGYQFSLVLTQIELHNYKRSEIVICISCSTAGEIMCSNSNFNFYLLWISG